MTNFSRLALVALATLITGTTIAIAAAPPLGPPPTNRLPHNNTDHPDYGIECRVHGDSFYVINWGNSVLDSGRQISWASPTTGDSGTTLLPKMLAPGEEVQLADALSAIVVPGSPCDVALV